MNIFYKWLMNSKSHCLYEEFERMREIVEEYGLITEAPSKLKDDILKIDEGCYVIFKKIANDKISYNIFYDNMHIRLETSPKETVYSIHLKKQDDIWKFSKDENGIIDFSHPLTQTFRVFVSYDIPVLNITRANGDSYTHGTWNKYVYNTITNFLEKINDCTDCSQFNKNYEN